MRTHGHLLTRIQRAWPTLAYDYRDVALRYHAQIQRVLTSALASWAASSGGAMDVDEVGKSVDAEFLAHLTALADGENGEGLVTAGCGSNGVSGSSASIPCPACGAPIEFATASAGVCCANGHDWGEYDERTKCAKSV